MKKAFLIVMTGIDGSGKTTQAHMLVETLRNAGLEVSYVWTRWEQVLVRPLTTIWKNRLKKDTGYADGRAIKNKPKKQKLLGNPFLRWLWLSAFFIDYGLQILVKVRFKMIRGCLIVSDRMFYDSVIDQAVNLGNNKDWLLDNLDSVWVKAIFPKPGMVLYIDCPSEVAFARKDDAPDIEYLSDRRTLYKHMAEKYGWIIIDGTLTAEKIAHEIKEVVNKKIALLNKLK